MLNKHLISPQIAPLGPDHTVGNALQYMDELEVAHLPFVNEGMYGGMLAEADLLDEDEGLPLSDCENLLKTAFAGADEHYFSAVRLMVHQKCTMVPVAGTDREYVGVIDRETLMRQMSVNLGVMDKGAVIVLQMEPQDFSISNLARLVESNDAHVTQVNTHADEESGMFVVTLRLNRLEVSDVVATMQRYDYTVLHFAGEEHYENELRRNYNNLMNFLAM